MILITDRMAGDVANAMRVPTTQAETESYLQGIKGAYNYTDLNRVEGAVKYIVNRLKEVGIYHTLNIKENWTFEEYPTQSSMERYLGNVRILRESVADRIDLPQLPISMNYLTFEDANDIEKVLEKLDIIISDMIKAFFYSNEVMCGEV